MSWLSASDYLAIEQAGRDRVGDAERFSSEHAFRPETSGESNPAGGPTLPAVCVLRCARRALGPPIAS